MYYLSSIRHLLYLVKPERNFKRKTSVFVFGTQLCTKRLLNANTLCQVWCQNEMHMYLKKDIEHINDLHE